MRVLPGLFQCGAGNCSSVSFLCSWLLHEAAFMRALQKDLRVPPESYPCFKTKVAHWATNRNTMWTPMWIKLVWWRVSAAVHQWRGRWFCLTWRSWSPDFASNPLQETDVPKRVKQVHHRVHQSRVDPFSTVNCEQVNPGSSGVVVCFIVSSRWDLSCASLNKCSKPVTSSYLFLCQGWRREDALQIFVFSF